MVSKEKVLVTGKDARVHALCHTLAQHPDVGVFCAPGNAGIHSVATCVPHSDPQALVEFAKEENIGTAIIGPEQPLFDGSADFLRAEGICVLGPSRKAARAEGSKAWFHELCIRCDIPRPITLAFTFPYEALCYIRERGVENIVIKVDGPAAGKGVTVPETEAEAERAITEAMVDGKFGNAGRRVLVEDRLTGVECSVTAIVDDDEVSMLPVSCDHKRLCDGDAGPNTGGMGAHTVTLPVELQQELKELVQRVAAALAAEGCPFNGFLYLGVMLTKLGPYVLECNVRLGDPEAQVLLPSVEPEGFAEACLLAARGERFTASPLPTQVRHALCVVLASGEYPGASPHDYPITGIGEDGQLVPAHIGALIFHVRVFHAGTRWRYGFFTTNWQGRVLSVIATGATLEEARERAYGAVRSIYFPDMHYRRDIGTSRLELAS